MGKPGTLMRAVSSNSLASLKELKLPKFGLGNNEDQDSAKNLEYERTLMYGRYSANLAECARQEAERLKNEDAQQADLLFSKELQPYRGRISRAILRIVRPVWDHTFSRLGEDWLFLFLLGVIVATITFGIDFFVTTCFQARMYLQKELFNTHWTLELFIWILIPTLCVTFSVAFCQWLAPCAAGSGIPEMKTILRGVVLKEYLTWKTLVTKIVSLAAVLGSGMPLGKEGPVMHMASIVSTMLMKVLASIKGAADNEGHTFDLLAAASTMGVAVSYGAPIGGVLFSIEVTAVYFAVRNYWRGFFAAIVGSTFYNLMGVWFFNHRTLYPKFKVFHNFPFPYDVIELLPFICLGVLCGFAGSLFVYLHRRYVIFMRTSKRLKKILLKSRFIYPTLVAVVISGMTYPGALGKYMASTSTTKRQALDLFSNVTWTTLPGEEMSFEQKKILQHWVDLENPNFHFSLALYQIVSFIQILVASTLPVPNGILIPLFKVGTAFGRQVGEAMVSLYPYGITAGSQIVPGAYAMVGAASFCAAITHTISISVIVFELTGQITYVIPIMVGVMTSNCVASMLQPSIYESVIRIKKLPYLPDISTTSSEAYRFFVEDFMVRDVVYIWYGMTYLDLKLVLKENMKLKYFPLVDNHESLILLGSVPRVELVRLLVEQVSTEKRRNEAKRRDLAALRKRWEEEDNDEEDGSSRPRAGSLETLKPSKTATALVKGLELPLTSTLRNLFPSIVPFTRDETRFSVSKVQKGSKDTTDKENKQSEDKTENDGEDAKLDVPKDEKSSEEKSGAESEGYKSESSSPQSTISDSKPNNKLFKKVNSKLFLPFEKLKAGGKQPARLTRSNSLDSIRVTPVTKVKKLESSKKVDQSEEDLTTASKSTEEDDSKSDTSSNTDNTDENEETENSSRKSGVRGFLKRRNSLSLGFLGPRLEPSTSSGESPDDNYQTITVVDSKLRHALDKVKKIKMSAAASQLSLFKLKKKDGNKNKVIDFSPDERAEWEFEELSKKVNFDNGHIDPAPFQLVERTSLLKVHSMFSMLGVNYAYVTAIGRLIGVVALKEVRAAIEGQVKKPDTIQTARGSPASLSSRNRFNYSSDDPEAGLRLRKNGKSKEA